MLMNKIKLSSSHVEMRLWSVITGVFKYQRKIMRSFVWTAKQKLNPVLWIAKYLDQLNQVTQRNNRMLAEVREIQAKLEKKNKFMCKHCHEVNTIDFKKLPSQAAVVRGMAVIDQEFDGMKVEHSR